MFPFFSLLILALLPHSLISLAYFNGTLLPNPLSQLNLFLGYQLLELTTYDPWLTAEGGFWNIASPTKTGSCAGVQFIGGSSVFVNNGDSISRQYTGLPSHNSIYFSALFVLVGIWGNTPGTHGFQVQFDSPSNSLTLPFWNTFYTYFPSSGCGAMAPPGLTDLWFWGKAPHYASTLNLKVVYLNPDGAAATFGIRDISMLVSSEVLSPGFTWHSNSFTLAGQGYPCTFPNYYWTGGSCTNCHVSCAICSGSLNTQCIRCNPGYFYDGTYCQQCHPSCSTCKGPLATDCDRCTIPLYLLGTECISCAPPLIAATPDGAIGFCSTPCPASQYIYDNGGCADTCDPRFISVINQFGKFCQFPCPAGSTFYADSTCNYNPCTYPLIQVYYGAYKICQYLCPAGQMAFKSNSTCISSTSCNHPYATITYGAYQSCEPACPTTPAPMYTYWNGSCQNFCPSRMHQVIVDGYDMCNPPRCGAQECDRCAWDGSDLTICKAYYYCSVYYGKFCLPFADYVLQTDIIKPILNGYILRAQVSPTTGLVSGVNDTLKFSIDDLSENLDYFVSIQKVNLGSFILTVQFLRQLHITTMTSRFTYSPITLDLQDTLNLDRTIFIDDGVQSATDSAGGSSQIMFLFFLCNIIGMIFSGGLTALWTALPESQYSYYLLFLNIEFPHNSQVYLESMNNYDILVSSSNGNDTVYMDPIWKESLPNKFFVLNYHPDFFDNVDQVVIQLIITLGGLLLSHLVVRFLRFPRELSFIRKLLDFLIDIFKWNGIWRQLLVYVLPMSTAALIQVYISIFRSDSSVFAVVGAGVAIVVMSIALTKMILLIRYSPMDRLEKAIYNKLYGTLWADLNMNSFTKYYFWFVAARSVLLSYVCVFLDMFPYVQIFIILFYQMAIVLMFFTRKGKVRSVFAASDLNMITLLQEFFLLFMKFVILVFTFMRETAKDSTLIILGWLIILPGVASQMLQIGYAMMKQLQNRKKFYSSLALIWGRILSRKKKKRIKRVQRVQRPRDASSMTFTLTNHKDEDTIIQSEM